MGFVYDSLPLQASNRYLQSELQVLRHEVRLNLVLACHCTAGQQKPVSIKLACHTPAPMLHRQT